MLFEELEGEQILFSFSSQLYKYFGITPNMIYILKKSGMYLNFDILFPKKKLRRGRTRENRHNKNTPEDNNFEFDYKNYLPVYKKLLECDGLNDISNYSQLKDKLGEISMMASENKKMFFNIIPKEVFENSGIKYQIYNIKEQKRKKKYQNLIEKSTDKLGSLAESEVSEEENRSDDFDDKYEGKGLNVSMPTMTSAASLSRASSIKTLINKKKDEKANEKAKNQESVAKYTIIILFFGLFLVAVSVVFLYLEINENNKFKQLFQLFQTFKIFKQGIESSPLSLLSNYCYYNGSQNNDSTSHDNSYKICLNFYTEYSDNLSEKYTDFNNFGNLTVNRLIQKEIEKKYDFIIAAFNDYQKSIFNLDSGVINKISEITAFSYSITVEGNIVTLVQTSMNFISLCREFNNYITTLLDQNAYINELFSLVRFAEENISLVDLTSMRFISDYKDSFTQTRKIMLLMLMAYPSIHIGLSESSTIMQSEFHSSLNNIEVLLIIFFVLQIILNSILIIIFMMFLFVYVKMVKFNITAANSLFSDRNFLELQNTRIDQLKILSNLYQESPIKISERIDAIESAYKRKTGEIEKKTAKTKTNNFNIQDGEKEKDNDNLSDISGIQQKNIDKNNQIFSNPLKSPGSLTYGDNLGKENNIKNDNKLENKNNNPENDKIPISSVTNNNVPERVFNRITFGYKLILFISLSIYLFYCVIFFLVVLLGCNRLSYLVNYCEVNNEIDGYLFDNFNTLLYMYISCSNSEFYGKIIDGNRQNYDYLNEGINKFYAAIQEKETIELEHKNIFPALYDIINLDCSKGMIPDEYFQLVFDDYKEENINYNEYFKVICKVFPVATTGNDNTMLFEVLYMIDQLFNKYEQLDFGGMFNQLHSSVLFDCYTLVLTLNRIIRFHFNTFIFIDEVDSVFNYFTTLIIIYLVLNMVFEVILFLILNIGIIFQIKRNNKRMLDFISSLKF